MRKRLNVSLEEIGVLIAGLCGFGALETMALLALSQGFWFGWILAGVAGVFLGGVIAFAQNMRHDRIADENQPIVIHASASTTPKTQEETTNEPIPDLIEPVEGFRSWRIELDIAPTPSAHLSSMSIGVANLALKPGENLAQCRKSEYFVISKNENEVHAAPNKSCACGFYAVSNLTDIPLDYEWRYNPETYEPYIIGVAEGYGKVLQYDKGWRAEKMRVSALIDPCAIVPWSTPDERYHRMLEFVAEQYDVPILNAVPELKRTEVPDEHRRVREGSLHRADSDDRTDG